MTARRRIRRIGVLRTASVLALVYGAVGAVLLIPAALIGFILVADAQPGDVGSLEFVQTALFSPLMYAFIGWPVSALVLISYNVIARWLGGFEYYVDEISEPIGSNDGADAPAEPA